MRGSSIPIKTCFFIGNYKNYPSTYYTSGQI